MCPVEPPAATPIISTTSSLSSKTGSSSRRFRNVLHNWDGGQRSHIELTTLDCSTYLLYPETTFDDDDGQGNRQGELSCFCSDISTLTPPSLH